MALKSLGFFKRNIYQFVKSLNETIVIDTIREEYVECLICETRYRFINNKVLCNGRKYNNCPYCNNEKA